MGANLQICESRTPDFVNEETIEDLDFQGNFQKLEDSIQRPPISQQLSDLISIKSNYFLTPEPFFKELNRIFSPKKITYKGGMYLGQISKFRSPQGWGKLYCQNGDVLIGQFSKGELMGKCFLGRPNGSYYQGEMANGKLNCEQGIYYCPEFQYVGGFNDNSFHRKGRIIKKNFILQGDFVDGVIQYGKLQWKQNGETYIYTGQFNQQMEMHGRGNIEQPYGTYTGQFKFNKKQGDGEYRYLNGNLYRGHYVCGKKKGYGELFSPFEEIIYRGEWAGDVPEKNPEVLLESPNVTRKKHKSTLKRVDSLRSTKTETVITSDQKI